jgi:hypothetical protein
MLNRHAGFFFALKAETIFTFYEYISKATPSVIPAKAGIQGLLENPWIPDQSQPRT